MRIFISLYLLFFTLLLTAVDIEKKYYSQVEQDKFINENFFKNKKNGIFVDIGAHDGITISNTYFFEKELGWTGVCFEPLPDIYQQLIKNRSCICINACVSEKNEPVDFVQVEGYSEMLSGMVSTYNPKHFQRLQREIEKMGGSYVITQVPSVNINTILEQYNLKNIDYISIDTEGSEFEILKSIDFDKINIYTLSVENNYKDSSIRKFMESKGFKYIDSLSSDEIYYNPGYFEKL